MARHRPVPHDTAEEIRELGAEGYGRNTISSITGINAGTVRAVLDDRHLTYVDALTPRQVTSMLMSGFGAKPST